MQEIKEEKEKEETVDEQSEEEEVLPYYKISALESEYKPVEMAHDIARN